MKRGIEEDGEDEEVVHQVVRSLDARQEAGGGIAVLHPASC